MPLSRLSCRRELKRPQCFGKETRKLRFDFILIYPCIIWAQVLNGMHIPLEDMEDSSKYYQAEGDPQVP